VKLKVSGEGWMENAGKASRELKIKIHTIDMYGTKAKKV